MCRKPTQKQGCSAGLYGWKKNIFGGCSECAWVFNPSGPPTGNSFDEMMRNFELQRDREFSSHVCADHPSP